MGRRKNKNIIYSDYVIDLLDKHKDKDIETDCKHKIAKDLYILAKYEEIPTSELALIFNVSIRFIQMLLKEMNIQRSLVKAKEVQVVKNSKTRKEDEAKYKEKKIKIRSKVISTPNIESDYVVYRFLDGDNKIVYIGSCSRSIIKYNRYDKDYTREYFFKQRLQHHYADSQKHLPKFIYDSVVKIEYTCCDSEIEMLEVEGNLILEAKINGQCMWNGRFPIEMTLDVSNVEWNTYKVLTEYEINNHRLRF